MSRYTVTVTQRIVVYQTASIETDAADEKDAEGIANTMNMDGDLPWVEDYSHSDPCEYSVERLPDAAA